MAIQFLDVTDRITAGVNVDSFSYTVPGGTACLFVHNCQLNGAARGDVNVATFNGVSMTYIGESQQANGQESLMWYLLLPAIGAYTLVVDISPEFNATTMYTTIVSLGGIVGYRGRATANGSSTTPSVAVTTLVGDLVLGGVQKNAATTTATSGSDETERADFGMAWLGSEIATGASTTIAPTLSASEPWAIQAAALIPVLGRNQIIWVWFQRQQKFLQDLKRGLIPPNLLRRRYREVYAI